MTTFESVKLGDIASVISGYAFKSSEFGDVGIPVIKIANIRVGSVDLSDCAKVSPEYLSRINDKYRVNSGDILISLTGSHLTQPNSVVGRVARMPINGPQCLLNQRAGKVIIENEEQCDSGYLYRYLSLVSQRGDIAVMASGAASQANVSPTQVESLAIMLPGLGIQQRITSILSAYDDLIENNLRRIKILEEMVQNLYHEWFVKFRFPGHEQVRMVDSPLGKIPKGWDVKGMLDAPHFSFVRANIKAYGGIKTYFATADIDGLSILNDGADYSWNEKPSRAQKQPAINSVWFARMQDTYKVLPVVEQNEQIARSCMLSSGFAGFEVTEEICLPYLFALINSKEFHAEKDRYCTGATQRSLTNDGLSRILTTVPPAALVEQFGALTRSMVGLLVSLQQKNSVLRRTRDLLLPKLISGELDISELDIDIGEAA